MENAIFEVEVVYCTPRCTWQKLLRLSTGATARDALQVSGVYEAHGWPAERTLALGIYGVRVTEAERLRPGDRLEIYHPLPLDPMERRRRRARERAQR